MGEIRDRMQQDLSRRGYAKATQDLYLACARDFVAYFDGRSPLKLGQAELREFIAHLESRKLSVQRVRGYMAALKFLYGRTLARPAETSWIAFGRTKRCTPSVLAGSEVVRVLEAIEVPLYRATAQVLYGAGLRVSEALALETRDVLTERQLLHVRFGKGGHERFAMLSPRLLVSLREYWRAVRPTGPLLFPSPHVNRDTPVHRRSVRDALRRAALAAGITKRVTPHILRHSFATHMLEMGTDLRVIQQLLGHRSIRSTTVYAQVTSALVQRTKSPLDVLGTAEGAVLG